jgi:hypothetical protein
MRVFRGAHSARMIGTLLMTVGCNQLMGIEEAYVDASLERGDTTTGSGGSRGSGDADVTVTNSATASSAGGTTSATETTGAPQGEAGESGSDRSAANSASTVAAANSSAGPASVGSTSQGSLPATLCESYCDDIMELCVGPQLQYRDHAQCMAICNALPEGTLGETNKNTVACRAKYAGDARYASGTELQAYCRQSGPGGDGRCGSNCQGLCSIMMNVCTPETAGVYSFKSMGECVSRCEALPQLESGYSASDPTIADGNHVQCRLFHVMSAAMLDPEEHCEHAMGITLCEMPADP